MTEAFRTSVSLTLQNEVTAGLRAIASDLRAISRATKEAQAALDGLGRGRGGFSQGARAAADGERDGRAYGEAFGRAASDSMRRSASTALVPAPRLLTYAGGGGAMVSAPMMIGYSGGGGGGRGRVPTGGSGGGGLVPGGGNAMQAMFARGAGGIGGGGGGGGGIPLGGINGPGNLMGAGYVAAGMGRSMIHAFGATAHGGMEMENQITNMRAAGQTQQEVSADVTQAWKTSSEVLSVSVVENLKSLRELRYALGDSHHAVAALSGVQQMTTVLSAVTGGRLGANEAFSAAKFLEMRGAASSSERFTQEAGLMTNSIVASGGKVLPRDFLNFSKRAGSTYTSGLSNEFLYAIAPRLMQEQGGDGAGTSLASIGQSVIAGVAGQRSINAFKSAGLINDGGITYARNGAAKGLNPGAIKGGDLFLSDPYAWTQKYLAPVFAGKTHEELISGVARMFGNRTAARQITLMLTQQGNFEKDRKLYHDIEQDPFKTLANSNPQIQMAALHAQWSNFTSALGQSMIPIIVPALRHGAEALNAFARVSKSFPGLTSVALTALLSVGVGLFALGRVASAIGSFTVLRDAIRGLSTAGSASAAAGLTSLASAVGKIVGILGVGALAWEGINKLGELTRPGSTGSANLAHNMLFDPNPLHWSRNYRDPATSSTAPAVPHTAPARAGPISYAPARDGHALVAHTTLTLDRRVFGQATTRWQGRELERPAGSRNAFDGTRGLVAT